MEFEKIVGTMIVLNTMIQATWFLYTIKKDLDGK